MLSYRWGTNLVVANPLQFLITRVDVGGLGLDVVLYNPSDQPRDYRNLECWTDTGPSPVGAVAGRSCLGDDVDTFGSIGPYGELRVASFVPDGSTYLRAYDVANGHNVVAGGDAVPEPGTVALMGAGALMLIGAARRRRGRT